MNKTYKKLYKRDSAGKIRVWWAQQFGNEYCYFSGINEGQIVQSKNTIAKPKNTGKANATTAEEQATLEIEAKYKKQQKLGYTEDIDKIDTAKEFVQPMLAKHYKDYAHKIDLSSGQYILQCKLNGMRCIATKDGLFTRKGEKYLSVPHIEEALKPFFEENPEAVLDGELFNEDLRQQLNEISKLVRKTVHITEEDLARSREIVKYYIYDGYDLKMDEDTYFYKGFDYCDRKAQINWFVDNLKNKSIKYVADYFIDSEEELYKIYNRFIEDGHEGAILRDILTPYENKRSKHLLKIKPEDDSEAVIVDIIEGNGNWSGTAKTATLKWNNDKTFDATFKGTQEQLKNILENKEKWVDREVTFLYNGLTGLGTPNFARIDVNNCFKK